MFDRKMQRWRRSGSWVTTVLYVVVVVVVNVVIVVIVVASWTWSFV